MATSGSQRLLPENGFLYRMRIQSVIPDSVRDHGRLFSLLSSRIVNILLIILPIPLHPESGTSFAFYGPDPIQTVVKGDQPMILFYAANEDRVVEALERQIADFSVVRCRSFDTMAKRLRRPRHGLHVALAVVSGQGDIERLDSIRGLLRDLRLVVVLPGRDETIVSWAHKLGPRFIAYADGGYEQVGAVLKKMMTVASRKPALVEGEQ
jgi:hypothetical protein